MSNTIFAPGQTPGPYAGGIVNEGATIALMEKQARHAGKPQGNNVTAKFPWWRTISESFVDNARRIPQQANWPAGFPNRSDHVVNVEEVRMRGTVANWTGARGVDNDLIWIRMGISGRKPIIEEWLPWHTLNTEMDRVLLAELDTYCYKFPTRYFLNHTSPFAVDVRYDANIFIANVDPDEYSFMMGLHGYDYKDSEPIDIIIPIWGWERDNPQANDFQTLSFDELRERPLRDAWITHMTMGSAVRRNTSATLQAVQIRPHPPEGPDWNQGDWFRLDCISEQIGSSRDCSDYVIHRPKVPYELRPGERFEVEIWNRTGQTTTIETTLMGTQEV